MNEGLNGFPKSGLLEYIKRAIDSISVAISGLVTSVNALPTTTSLSSQAGIAIKSIQRGIGTTDSAGNATVSISSVNLNKCELRLLGFYGSAGNGKAWLSGSTTVSIYAQGSTQFSWELTEYY